MRSNISTGSVNLVPAPNWLVYLQCICFSVLFGIWIQPETILIRHVCLFLGGIFSLYVIFRNKHLLFTRSALPIWLIVGLFAWVAMHLMLFSRDLDAQWLEFTTIWKRTALGLIFAIGMGISIAIQAIANSKASKNSWWIVYAGLAFPTAIYGIKLVASGLTNNGVVVAPDFLLLYSSAEKFYIHKSSYVFFCLPLLAVSLGRLFQLYKNGTLRTAQTLIYCAGILAVLATFALEKVRNGQIYALLFGLIFFGLLAKDYLKATSLKSKCIGAAVFLVPLLIGIHQLKENEYWNNFLSDANIAIQIDRYDHWKDTPTKGLPINDQGKMLTGSNYERVAWMHVAARLISDNPLGYGLVEGSFGRLSIERWPDSTLSQSHSGWLDFTLGLGIPGALLLLAAGILSCFQAKQQPFPWQALGRWGLAAVLLLLCTTEVSQRVYIDALIFIICLCGALNLGFASLALGHKSNESNN